MSKSSAVEPSTFTCPRRQVLIGAGAGGVALLAACGSSGGSKANAGTGDTGASTSAPASTSSSAPSSAAAVKGIIALSAVPSDKAVSVKDPTGRTLLITQSGGQLTALDSTCTHMGCTVAPHGSNLQCPCHFSEYTLTGAVTKGPAPAALHPVNVKVVSGQVVLA